MAVGAVRERWSDEWLLAAVASLAWTAAAATLATWSQGEQARGVSTCPALHDAAFRPPVERKWTLLALDSGLLTWPSARSYGRFSGVQIEQAKVT
jgi:hypothetical protein